MKLFYILFAILFIAVESGWRLLQAIAHTLIDRVPIIKRFDGWIVTQSKWVVVIVYGGIQIAELSFPFAAVLLGKSGFPLLATLTIIIGKIVGGVIFAWYWRLVGGTMCEFRVIAWIVEKLTRLKVKAHETVSSWESYKVAKAFIAEFKANSSKELKFFRRFRAALKFTRTKIVNGVE